jgi:glutamate/tyrosine decarboxylase-like PLP-dependent enzyme
MTKPIPPDPVPDLDWSADRASSFAVSTTQIWAEVLSGFEGDLPIARAHSAAEVRDAVAIDIPDEPLDTEDLLDHLRTVALSESIYPGHQGFLAYISGSGTVPGAAADLLAAGLNQNSGGFRLAPAGVEIEQHMMRWIARRLGMPETTLGYMTSGGSMSNLIGLTAARNRQAGWDVRADGMRAGPQLAVYVSSEVHDTVERAAQILGIGDSGVRKVPTDSRCSMDVDALEKMVAADIANGIHPIAVIGTAGTTGTGAIDPLDAIADLCEAQSLWFHVDAAYGGPAAMTDQFRDQFDGIGRADSLGMDPHKWLYTPHASACVLVRDPSALSEAFAVDASYIVTDNERTGSGLDIYEVSPQYSRPSSALKVWVSLLAHGWNAYERRIAHDIALAEYLHELVLADPELQPMSEPGMSITCFRYVPADLAGDTTEESYLDDLNERIMFELQLDGRVFPSNAIIGDRFALRTCVVNFRTEAPTMDLVASETVRIGRILDAGLRSTAARRPNGETS